MKETEIKEALKDWPEIVVKYSRPDTKKAIIQVLNTFLPFIGIWILMIYSLQYSYWITLALGLLNGFMLARLFIIQHDCGHQSFFKSKYANNVVGFVCSLFTSLPYKYWARVHNFHHGHIGQLEHRDVGDINFLTVEEFRTSSKWKRFGYRIFRSPIFLFILTPVLYVTISNRYPFFRFKGWEKIRRSQVWNNLALLGFYILVGSLIGWRTFLLVQVPVIVFFAIIAFWFFYVQHQHEETYMRWKNQWDFLLASIQGSTYYKLPKVFQWLTGNIGFHHIHHLNSKIPNYELEKCAKENPILQKYVPTINFMESLKCIFNNLWDEQAKRMISFREFYRMEKQGTFA
ncbi:MAG: fatty acid desaturase [Saprospiraceae bacterium]|nr:fatty acid desaturase [Saprospiraceae bacterium]